MGYSLWAYVPNMISFSQLLSFRSVSASFHQAATLQRRFMAKRDEAVYDILDSTRSIPKALEIATIAIAFLALLLAKVFRASFPASKYASKLATDQPRQTVQSFTAAQGRI